MCSQAPRRHQGPQSMYLPFFNTLYRSRYWTTLVVVVEKEEEEEEKQEEEEEEGRRAEKEGRKRAE